MNSVNRDCKIFSLIVCILVNQFDFSSCNLVKKTKKPNVIIIIADDLGFNDVGFRGSSQVSTPNIDALAYNGVVMSRFYTTPLCTPTRASLMTGKYPSNIGMQHSVILPPEPWALSLKNKILPQFFKEAGYKTHLVGKWHLGHYQQQYYPTNRGFDTHFGFLGPLIDYFNHTYQDILDLKFWGYDMRKNLEVNFDIEPNKYITNLFTEESVKIIKNHNDNAPLFLMLNHLAPHAGNQFDRWQAPKEEIEKFSYIKDNKRKVLAAMISLLDKSVGDVVKAVSDKGMLDNTIILFFADNGAPTHGVYSTRGSNYPLRGQKQTSFEGGSRTVGLVYSPLLVKPQRVSQDWIHVADLLPTLASAANIALPSNLKLDGIDQWQTLSEGKKSLRREVVVNLDTVQKHYAYIYDGWKIVSGTHPLYQQWYGKEQKPKIFNLTEYIGTVFNSETGRAINRMNHVSKSDLVSTKSIEIIRKESKVFCDPYANTLHLLPCVSNQFICLFELYRDPCEMKNLALKYPRKLLEIKRMMDKLVDKAEPSRRKEKPRLNPKEHNNTITWWQPNGNID